MFNRRAIPDYDGTQRDVPGFKCIRCEVGAYVAIGRASIKQLQHSAFPKNIIIKLEFFEDIFDFGARFAEGASASVKDVHQYYDDDRCFDRRWNRRLDGAYWADDVLQTILDELVGRRRTETIQEPVRFLGAIFPWRFRDAGGVASSSSEVRAAFEAAWIAGEYEFAYRLVGGEEPK